jgi:xylulokinase
MLLGIDLGTSSIKVVLFAPERQEIVAQAKTGIRIANPSPETAEADPGEIWDALCGLLRQLDTEAPNALDAVRGIGLSVIFPALVPMDSDGRALSPAILYCDRRSQSQVRSFGEAFGRKRFERLTGNQLTPGTSTLPGILWLRECAPAVYRDTAVFGQISTFLVHRLTGEWSVDMSHASLSGMTEAGQEERWSEIILSAAGIDPERLPPILPSVDVAGRVTRAAAAQTSLRAGIPVVAGCGDAPLAAFGGGVIGPGQVFCSAGTTDCLMFSGDRPSGNTMFCNVRCPTPNLWVSIGTMSTAGAAVKWFCEQFMTCTPAEMTAWAADAPPGAGGVVFLPYLQGERTPHWNPDARGMFFGLALTTGRAEAARAVFEGVACGWRQIISLLEDEYGFRPREIITVGGGSTNDAWNRIKATMLARPVRVLEMTEITSLGAAMVAGLACGVYDSPRQAVEQTEQLRRCRTIEPVAAWQDACDDTFRRYSELYPAVRPLFGQRDADRA